MKLRFNRIIAEAVVLCVISLFAFLAYLLAFISANILWRNGDPFQLQSGAKHGTMYSGLKKS